MTDASRKRNPVAVFHANQKRHFSRWQGLAFPDIWLIVCWMNLMVIGMVMVTSSSLSEASVERLNTFHFAIHQGVFYCGSLIVAYVVFSLGSAFFYEKSAALLVLSGLLLLALYIPGVGQSVNGARRWIDLRVIHLQVGEIVKVTMILYAAAFLKRNSYRLESSWKPIVTLLGIVAAFSVLLVEQPDFGTMAVLVTTVLGMMFLAGVSWWRFLLLALGVGAVMAVVLFSASYRVQRLLAFTDPWSHQFDEGYQLVNSLISFGRGRIFGVGLGESIQKHQYLPEAHTDFIFAIIAEETGLVGTLSVLMIFAVLVWRAFLIAHLADRVRKRFASNTAYGIGLLLAIQTLVNIGVTTGALPTKGLTLPLISYGGSSVLMTCVALALLARIDAEARFQARREGKL